MRQVSQRLLLSRFLLSGDLMVGASS
ncbi:LEPR-XLL domain-containing protein [Sessilibacter sp. MAH4]